MWSPKITAANVVILPCLVLSFIDQVYGIYCYQCNSNTDEGCSELEKTDVSSHYYKECESKSADRPQFCRKVHLKLKMEFLAGPIHDRIIRSCGWSRDNKRDCYRREDKDHTEISCQCFEDGCNTSTALVAFPAVLFISVLGLLLK